MVVAHIGILATTCVIVLETFGTCSLSAVWGLKFSEDIKFRLISGVSVW